MPLVSPAKACRIGPSTRGSVFAIFGTGLGPSTGKRVSAFPLETTFEGVSISVTQGRKIVAAIPLYVSATQINVVMPSDAPIGSDTIAVTYNGQTSSAPCACPDLTPTVQVVRAGFGIFAINQAGSGQGVFTNANNQAISYTSSAAPGEILNIWGTGLGAIAGSDTEPPMAGNIGSGSPTVYVGGVEVTSGYHGRSPCCSGIDQIQFQVPPDITGCNIPVAVQIGNVVSNFVSIAIASSITSDGGACSDPTGISASNFASFAAQGTVSAGYVSLSRDGAGGAADTVDYGYADFEKFQYANFSLTQLPLQILNAGACSVYTYNPVQTAYGPPFQVATPTINSVPGVALDAGPAITISGPNGEKQITPVTPPYPASAGNYGAILGGPSQWFVSAPYLSQGSYTITGSGGKDVGPFTVSLQMPAPLTWTNQGSVNNITRANGVTVTWTGADPNSYVIVSGGSDGNGADAGFNCTAKASDGQFTVPAIVLLALPASAVLYEDGQTQPEGSLSVGTAAPPVTFSAAGLNAGQASSSISFSQIVMYQ
jgi:uncharacterized protein (TIGR03437 family)